ncbi:MAG: hypothetical protein ABW061_22050 [Polyangiaceae bacterium]
MTKLAHRYDPVRALTVTLGLACAGALFGGMAGAAGLAIALFFEPRSWRLGFECCQFAGSVGAALGAIGAPTVTWVMLRRVPLGQLFTRLTLGTTAGAIFGWFAFSGVDLIWGPTLAAFAAFLATAIALSFKYDPTPRRAPRRYGSLTID